MNIEEHVKIIKTKMLLANIPLQDLVREPMGIAPLARSILKLEPEIDKEIFIRVALKLWRDVKYDLDSPGYFAHKREVLEDVYTAYRIQRSVSEES